MKNRLVKLGVALLSLCLVASAGSLRAQDTNDNVPPPSGYPNDGTIPQPSGYGGRSGSFVELPVFDIQIENGLLSLAPLKGLAGATNFGSSGALSAPANMENLAKFMHVVDPHLNIVLAPGTGGLVVSGLKLKTSNLNNISQAIAIATGNTVIGKVSGPFGGGGGGGGLGGRAVGGGVERMLAFISQSSGGPTTVEVFNLNGYIQSLGNPNDDIVRQKLDVVQELIAYTLESLHFNASETPQIRYHAGTKLLIVTGKPEAMDVTRKIVNALSGQQKSGKLDLLMPLDTPPPAAQK